MPPKKGKKEEAPPAPSEFDSLSLAQLKETVLKLRDETSKLAADRNQVATDRDAIDNFFSVTKRELRDAELQALAKQREMETVSENHRIEVRVYQQKVKHLEYEHGLSMKRLQGEEDGEMKEEDDLHLKKEALLRSDKGKLRSAVREMEATNAEAIRTLKLMQEKNVQKLRQEFRATLEGLKTKYEARLSTLRADLTLRHKVEVHEVEERKNLHINQLMRAHSEAFTEIKKYYNDITKANLELISTLKAQIAEANEKQAANQKLMLEIAEENKRLSDPLQRATAELHSLQSDLKDADKDSQSLAYAKSRLRSLRAQLAALESSHSELERRYADVEAERDDLYHKFESTVRAAHARSEQQNQVLEKRLGEAELEFSSRRVQVDAVLHAAQLDPHVLKSVQSRLDAALDSRQDAIMQLQGDIGKLTKAHNDAVRTLSSRMRDLGVPQGELDGLDLHVLPTTTTSAPAGLIAKPSIS